MSDSQPTSIDWRRLYPHGGHRWQMGIHRGNLAEFFAHSTSAEAVLAERARWLESSRDTYSALPDAALPVLAETVALARTLGIAIDAALTPAEQLLALGRAWEPDFVWMHPTADGLHRLLGGVVCFPSSWALGDKLGGTMNDIHAPVPGLNDALAHTIEAFLTRLAPGDTWLRENANFAADGNLNHHPLQPRQRMDASTKPEDFFLRFERQLLYKLPLTGCILFAIRIETTPLTVILRDPLAADRLAAVFTTMSATAAEYKGLAAARETLLTMCREPRKGAADAR